MDSSRRTIIKTLGAYALLGISPLNSLYGQEKSRKLSWSTSTSMPISTQEIYPAVWNGEIYIAGGFVKADKGTFYGLSPTDKTFIFNPISKKWREGPNLPEVRHHLGMATSARYLYGLGGFYGVKGKVWQAQSRVYRLTPKANAWEPGPDLPDVRGESVYATVDNNIHVIGGRTLDRGKGKNVDTKDHLVLVGDEHWEVAAPASITRNSAACAVMDNKIFVLGGRAYADKELNKTFAEVYDPSLDKWERIQPLPTALAGLAASVLGDTLYVFGGEVFGPGGNWKTGSAKPEVWSYDPQKDQWNKEQPMPQARHGHGAVSLNNTIYVMGGGSLVGPQNTLSSMLAYNLL